MCRTIIRRIGLCQCLGGAETLTQIGCYRSNEFMNRLTPALLIVAVVAVMSGCQPALDTNRNNAIGTGSTAKETYDASAIEAEIINLEREWADANKTHSSEAVKRFLSDNAVIVYPDGSTATKA